MISESDIIALLHDLRNGEPTAPRRLVLSMRPPLMALLRKQFALLPREVVEDAVHDALLVLIEMPERYDSSRSHLLTFLIILARRKVIDNVREWARHKNL